MFKFFPCIFLHFCFKPTFFRTNGKQIFRSPEHNIINFETTMTYIIRHTNLYVFLEIPDGIED